MENNTCPICGGALLEPYELQDGTVCGGCAEDLRFQYPIVYLPRVGMLEEHPRCQALRRKELTYLRKHRREFFADGATCYHFDLMSLLTVEEFKDQIRQADAAENRIRLAYQDYTNVLTVECAGALPEPIGKKGIQNIRRLRSCHYAVGPIQAGQFREGDMVWILHDGQRRHADVLALREENMTVDPKCGDLRGRGVVSLGSRGNQGNYLRAGYQAVLILSETAEGIQPGDWIVTD